MSVFEQAKGAVKQKVGDLTDQDDLRSEGEAQQAKGKADTTAEAERAKAQKDEMEADALDSQADKV